MAKALPTASAGSPRCLPSQNGLLPDSLQPQKYFVPDSSAVHGIGVNSVPLWEPSQKGCSHAAGQGRGCRCRTGEGAGGRVSEMQQQQRRSMTLQRGPSCDTSRANLVLAAAAGAPVVGLASLNLDGIGRLFRADHLRTARRTGHLPVRCRANPAANPNRRPLGTAAPPRRVRAPVRRTSDASPCPCSVCEAALAAADLPCGNVSPRARGL